MNLNLIIILAITIAFLGTIIGVSMIAVDKDRYIQTHGKNAAHLYQPPSRRKLFLPMILTISFSLSLIIISYQTGNIILFMSGFLFVFIGFGVMGIFLMSK
jgi:hypothetical protein